MVRNRYRVALSPLPPRIPTRYVLAYTSWYANGLGVAHEAIRRNKSSGRCLVRRPSSKSDENQLSCAARSESEIPFFSLPFINRVRSTSTYTTDTTVRTSTSIRPVVAPLRPPPVPRKWQRKDKKKRPRKFSYRASSLMQCRSAPSDISCHLAEPRVTNFTHIRSKLNQICSNSNG